MPIRAKLRHIWLVNPCACQINTIWDMAFYFAAQICSGTGFQTLVRSALEFYILYTSFSAEIPFHIAAAVGVYNKDVGLTRSSSTKIQYTRA